MPDIHKLVKRLNKDMKKWDSPHLDGISSGLIDIDGLAFVKSPITESQLLRDFELKETPEVGDRIAYIEAVPGLKDGNVVQIGIYLGCGYALTKRSGGKWLAQPLSDGPDLPQHDRRRIVAGDNYKGKPVDNSAILNHPYERLLSALRGNQNPF